MGQAEVGSCSYNYSNFDQPTPSNPAGVVVSESSSLTNARALHGCTVSIAAVHAVTGHLDGGQGAMAETAQVENGGVPKQVQQVQQAGALGCVVSSQTIHEVKDEVILLSKQGHGHFADVQCEQKESSASAKTGSVATTRDGEVLEAAKKGRRGRPKGWTKKKAAALYEGQEQGVMRQEGGVALWVKWRGKWRACIQCFPNDCSTATARAMPTYSKKTYVVVFFPNSRTYSWVDLQYACHITESPEPLAFGTHETGREAVDNLDMPKHHMLRVLAANMLDISDRLPIKAVVQSAQNVNAWKNFANEAVEAKEYPDISKMLIKLFWMIERSCYRKSWLEESYNRWKSDCETADSAQCVESLNKELVDAILWDDVSALWDAPEQSAVDSEWKDWKHAVIDNRSIYPNATFSSESAMDSDTGKRRKISRNESSDMGYLDLNTKRSKLEVRRRFSAPAPAGPSSEIASVTSIENGQNQAETCCISGFSVDNQQVEPISSMEQIKASTDGFLASSTPVIISKTENDDVPGRSLVNQSSVPTSKRLSSSYQLCAAYMEKKKRQCTRFPSQGSLYCCKHMNLANEAIEGVRKLEFSPKPATAPHKSTTILPKMPGDRICEGMTKYGRRCTHRAKENSFFCKKHTFADAPHLNPDAVNGINLLKPTEEKVEPTSQADDKAEARVDAQAQENSERVKQVSLRKRKLVSSLSEGRMPLQSKSYISAWHARRIGRIIKTNAGNRVRCLGQCVNGEQCSHKSRPGSSYCEKHQPEGSAHKLQQPVVEIKKQDDGQSLLKARTWLSRYMESANRKVDATDDADAPEKLLEWVLAEASKDISGAETLLKLVNQRKEKLGRFLKLQDSSESSKAEVLDGSAHPSVPEPVGITSIVATRQLSTEQIEHLHRQLDKIKCSICSDEFTELVDLGSHWKSSHTTEAHWFLKGYACKKCSKEFTNKSGLERHWKAEHEAISDTSAVTVCINCDEKFSDFEALWDHVVASHADHLSAMPTISMPPDDPMEDAKVGGDENDEENHNDDPALTGGFSKEDNEDSAEAEAEAVADESMESLKSEVSLEEEDPQYVEFNENSDRTPEGNTPGNPHLKYKCRICGKRFRLLPDLGRHHQAEHMSAHVGTISKSRTGGAASTSGRKRRRGKVSKHGMNSLLRIKAALHSVQQQQQQSKAASSEKPEVEAVAKLPGPPSNTEILSAACSACCEAQLHTSLDQKYESVPKGLFITVLKLAIKENRTINWTREGYVCPQNCKNDVLAADRASDLRLHIYRKGNAPRAESARKKTVVLCEDLSFGKEATPVPCVEDEEIEPCTCSQCREGNSYRSLRPWETFTYVTRRLLDPSLGLDTKDSQIGCACGKGRCTPKTCDHVIMFDNDNSEACDIWGEEMLARFPYDEDGRIILQEGYLVYECNSSCLCQESCPNRILQRGVRVKLEVFKTRHKGWAVRAAQHIPRGTFVCEYLGEVLNDQEANKRGERYDQVGCSYLYDIDVHLNTGRSRSRSRVKPFVIDATKYGNVARFINHSCSPNLVNYQVLVESMDYQLAHIGLYASRDIVCGEELSYDYRYKLLPGRGCPCHCGASGCRGRLY